MWLRRAFFAWLFPAAFLLPLWLLVGWIIFQPGGLALLWLLVIAMPSVFFGQLAFTLLVRARGTVRAERAVEWGDVLGFGSWHLLTIGLGFYTAAWLPLLIAAIAVGLALLWYLLAALFREAQPRRVVLQADSGIGYVAPPTPRSEPHAVPGVFVISERPAPPRN